MTPIWTAAAVAQRWKENENDRSGTALERRTQDERRGSQEITDADPDAAQAHQRRAGSPADIERSKSSVHRFLFRSADRAALRGAAPLSASPTIPSPRMAPTSPAPNGDIQILEQNGKLVQYFGLPGDLRPTRRSGASPWKDGDWLAFQLPDGEHLCGCCCGQYAPFGTIVLFNPEWAFAVAMAPATLERQIRDGLARVVSECALFDEAARRALQQMAPS